MKKSALAFAFLALTVAAQTPTEIEPLLARIATYQYGGDPAPAIQLDEVVGRLSGSPQMRRRIEDLLLRFLQSNATPAGKEAAFRQLSLVGSSASAPVLGPMLIQIDTAEMARYALTAIPGPAVDDALRKALGQAPSDRIRIGLVNSLGHRKDARAVPALSALVSSSNVEVTAAALAALASIADSAALDALAAARRTAKPPAGEMASEAYVVAADHLAARGQTAAAVNVYKQLIAPEEASTVRARALKGLTGANPSAAVPALAAELRSNSPDRQVPAIRLLATIKDPQATKVLTGGFANLPPVAQVHLLSALASRRDAAAKPVVLAGLGSGEPAVRASALAALATLGDASNVPALAEAAAGGREPEQTAARRSLYTLRGAGVDAAIVSGIGSTNGKVASEMIVAAGERALVGAADALTKAAQAPDAQVRRDALRALRNVGGAAQTPALMDLLLKSTSASERREVTLTLASVVRRAQPAPVGAVIAAYGSTPAREARLGLLEVMGQSSSAEALPLLRAAINDADPEIARAAILALTAWDDPAPLPDLLSLAKGAARSAGNVMLRNRRQVADEAACPRRTISRSLRCEECFASSRCRRNAPSPTADSCSATPCVSQARCRRNEPCSRCWLRFPRRSRWKWRKPPSAIHP